MAEAAVAKARFSSLAEAVSGEADDVDEVVSSNGISSSRFRDSAQTDSGSVPHVLTSAIGATNRNDAKRNKL